MAMAGEGSPAKIERKREKWALPLASHDSGSDGKRKTREGGEPIGEGGVRGE